MFASTGNKVLKVSKNNPAIADPGQWIVDARFPILDTAVYQDLETVNGALYFSKVEEAYGKDSIFRMTATGREYVSQESFEFQIQSLSVVNGNLAANIDGTCLLHKSDFSGYSGIYNTVPSGDFLSPFTTISIEDRVYMADKNEGLIEFIPGQLGKKIELIGPPKNSFYKMDYGASGLVVAGGGLNGIGRTFNNSGAYTYKDYQWKLYDLGTHPSWADSAESIYDFILRRCAPYEIRICNWNVFECCLVYFWCQWRITACLR